MKFNFEVDSLEKFLWVGDMHVKKGNIDESERLIEWIDKEASARNIPVVFSGDQYNDFGIARVEAVKFWEKAFRSLKAKTVALVGNHDANSDVSLNFMDIHSDQVWVIDKPYMASAGTKKVGLLPFYRKNDIFVEAMQQLAADGANIVMCHQEFNGCQYENGFYAPHGVDPQLIPTSIEQVIGGHIHKEQAFGKVWYPGTPRQLTRSDVGEVKGVFFVDLTTGNKEKIATPVDVSTPFEVIDVTPDWDGDLKKVQSPRVFVNISGPAKFVKQMVKKVPEGVKYRTFPESEVVESTVKESEGIPKAFFNFAMDYANQNGLGNAEIKVILEKIYDKCPTLKGNQ